MQSGRHALFLMVAALAAGCDEPGICGKKALSLEVSGNHGHDPRIAAKELARGPGRYPISGGTHEHGFRLSEADVEKLRGGGSVELRTTSMNAHVHELRVTCDSR